MVVSCSITKYRDGLVQRFEPPMGIADLGLTADDGHNVLRVVEHPGFADRAAACAGKAAAGLLADLGLTPDDVDLVVANPLTDEFRHAFAGHLVVAPDLIVEVAGAAHVHTAALLTALNAGEEQGRLVDAHRVLLVSAGAGIVAGATVLQR